MNLEEQVISVELAKKLKELGFKQKGYLAWFETYHTSYRVLFSDLLTNLQRKLETFCEPREMIVSKIAEAFTIAELGEILPNRVNKPDDHPFDSYTIVINKFYTVNEDNAATNNYIINYECDSTAVMGEDAWLKRKLTKNIYDPNLANAMAKMLIYLIENKFIQVQL